MPQKREINVLAQTNFPLYTIQMLTNRHLIVSGGGGSSRTGVSNGFEIFELLHDGNTFYTEKVVRHETGSNAIMCSTVYNDNNRRIYVLAGQENHCQCYQVQSCIIGNIDSQLQTTNTIRHRSYVPTTRNTLKNNRSLLFVLKPTDSFQTDFKGDEPLLKVVRLHPNGKILATAGTDGNISLWQFPSLQPVTTINNAHSKEIDDLDFCDDHLVSLSKDCEAIVWHYSKGIQIRKLIWQVPTSGSCKYIYKKCRFGRIEGKTDAYILYMITNPIGQIKNSKSYLQSWNYVKGILIRQFEYVESLSALAVRDDGRFLAVGSMFTGSVAIHTAFNLQDLSRSGWV